jgi:hypothetical protein
MKLILGVLFTIVGVVCVFQPDTARLYWHNFMHNVQTSAQAASTSTDANNCSMPAKQAQIMRDLQTAYDVTGWPMRPNHLGNPNINLDGQIQDFRVLNDNGGVLDCSLNVMHANQRWEHVRIIYTKNITGQLYFRIYPLP